MFPWLLCILLAAAATILLVKLWLLRRGLDEIAKQLGDRLSQDTNVLISLSARDAHARRLAAELNRHLRLLRDQRRRFQNGDRELKEAVTNISHDLRTPLTAIFGYLELLEREDNSPAVRRYLALISNRAKAMKQLTEELFRYSIILSAGEPVLEPVDIRGVLEESIAGFYAPLKERGIEPVISMPEGPVVRPLDRSLLARVFGNILSNALKYSGGDLEITLTAEGETAFTNTAPGLDGILVGRLFDRFFTVEAARNSTGLGLAISKSLVERMGGTITAEYDGIHLTVITRFWREDTAFSRC